ncbi:hypothetical protein EDB85DRAFT_1893409 [Lactarius pseudohatsudake]|nr:hypothetical protein EDB85DRAFT_1893409 [Lactarius pseudohatsudake]
MGCPLREYPNDEISSSIINHAEQALRQCRQDERTLLRIRNGPSTTAEDRNRKRQRGSEEPSAVQFAQPTTVEHLHMAVDTPDISHGTTPAIPKSPRIDAAPALTSHLVEPASQPSTTAVHEQTTPTLQWDKARKRKKTGGFINVRIYAERKDVDTTHEIQCALTPDGGLNLRSLPPKGPGCPLLTTPKEGYLRVVGQAPSTIRDQELSRFPSWQS